MSHPAQLQARLQCQMAPDVPQPPQSVGSQPYPTAIALLLSPIEKTWGKWGTVPGGPATPSLHPLRKGP